MLDFPKLFLIIESLFIILKSLDFIYLFQIKEYRFDRLLSHMREEGTINTFYGRNIRFPALKLRNYLLTIFALSAGIFFFISFQDVSLVSLIIFIPVLPIIAFVGVLLGVIATTVLVKYYRNRLIDKAAKMVKESQAIFIGITGSYGKTSTKEFLYQILSAKYNVAKTEKNMNSDIGVALSIIKNLKIDTEIFITEIGAYRLGEIEAVCRFVKPTYAILTGIGNQHLDLFGSKENLIQAKKELLYSLPEKGTAYINKDIQDLNKVTKNLKCNTRFYSTQHETNITANNILVQNHSIKANIQYSNHVFQITIPILGKHNVNNLLPCIALAFDLGITQDQIIDAAAKLHTPGDKLAIKKGPRDSTLIFDSNNTNLEGFIASIETASNFPHLKKIIASRGIIELGQEKQSSYGKIVQEVNQKGLLLYTTDELFQTSDQANCVRFFKNEQELLTDLVSRLDHDTLLVIEGKFTQKFLRILSAHDNS